MLTVDAEGQAQKISIVFFVVQPLIGRIGKDIGFNVQHGKRLVGVFTVVAVGAKATVQKNDETAVGRNRSGGRPVGCSRIVEEGKIPGHEKTQTETRQGHGSAPAGPQSSAQAQRYSSG